MVERSVSQIGTVGSIIVTDHSVNEQKALKQVKKFVGEDYGIRTNHAVSSIFY